MRVIQRSTAVVRDLPLFVKLLVPAALILALTIVGIRSGEERRDRSAKFHHNESAIRADSTSGEEVSDQAGTAAGKRVPAGSTARGDAQGRPGEVNRGSAGGRSANGGAGVGRTVTNSAGDRIAFVEGGEIYAMSLDGSGKTRLGPGSEPDWSPDGFRILYSLDRADGECVLSDPPCDIWIMNADGSNRRLVGPGRAPDWSPDGRRISYVGGEADHEIYVMNADGSGSAQLTQTPDSVGGRGYALTPDWSPDGSRITFSRREPCGQACWDVHVYVMDAGGSGLKILTNQASGGSPVWSPGGTHIAFSGTAVNQGDNAEIFTINSDGSDLRRLTHDAKAGSPMDNFDGLPAWSPDGRIIFTRDIDGPAGWGSCYVYYGQANCGTGGPALPEIFLMNNDGSGRVRIGAGMAATFAPRRR